MTVIDYAAGLASLVILVRFIVLPIRENVKEMRARHRRLLAMARVARELDDIANERLYAAVPVMRAGYAVQYRFHPHPRAECVNAQCVDHYGPFPLGGDRDDAR